MSVGQVGYVRVVTRPADDQPEQGHDAHDEQQRPDDDDRRERSRRADPDAPGNYVDDETSADVPEPNEPG